MRSPLVARQFVVLPVALLLLARASSAGAVSLTISSANVAQPGDATRLCVTLNTGGQEVAGTQNDLVWDGTCMTLNDGACFAAGSHGKQVNTRIQSSADFRMRVLVLSLTDVDPIPDGPLYCCNVQGEAEPGACCSISVSNTGASDSQGNAVGGVGGNSGRVCVQGGGDSAGGGPIGNVMGGQLGASNAAPAGEAAPAAAGAGAANAGAAAPAAPAAQVLQGGGGGVQVGNEPAAAAGVPTAPAASTPAAPVVAATAVAPAAGSAPAVPAAPAAMPAAAAPTLAPTAPVAPATAPPTVADTPTAAAPTAAPPTQAPVSTPTAPRSTPTAGRGWFGCQITSEASPAPALSLALLFAAVAWGRRRRRS